MQPVPNDDLLDRLPAKPFVPRWQRDFASLDERERASLASLCFSVWFRRAASASDIPRLREALAATLEHDDCDGPSAHQALRRLQRITAIGRLQAEAMASR